MKIAFVGNQDNNAYRICRWVRERGHDAHLYLIRQERATRSAPELVDADLPTTGYPDWLRYYDDKGFTWFLRPSHLARQIAREVDVVVTTGATGLVAASQFPRVPMVHLTLGSELSEFPFKCVPLRDSPAWWVVAFKTRRGLRRMHRIFTLGFWPEMRALARLKLLPRAVVWPFPEDSRRNLARVDPKLLTELNARYASYERVFLWFSRLNYRDPHSVSYKAPERFLEAFERLARQDGRNIRAVIATHGNDVEAFQQMARAKNLDPLIDYVPHLPFWKLLTYASIANAIVVDVPDMERGHALSGLVRETISVGAIVITAWDLQTVELCYGPGCPILNAVDAESCYQSMKTVLDMTSQDIQALRDKFQEWNTRCLHYEKPIDRLLEILRQVAYGGRFNGKRRSPAG